MMLQQDIWFCTPEHAEQIATLANLALSDDLPKAQDGESVGSYQPTGVGAFVPMEQTIEVNGKATRVPLRTGSQDNQVVLLSNGVALVPIRGTIAPKMNMMQAMSGGVSAELLVNTFDALAEDTRVRSVVLDVDSPGGSVMGVEEARQALVRLRDKKPVRAVANYMIASAATYITTAAHKTFAQPSSVTGSIGTIATFESESRRLEQEGIDVTIIRSGKMKAVPHSAEPLSEKGLELLQQRVDKWTARFYNALSENLGISMTEAEKMAQEGKTFEGADESIEAGTATDAGGLVEAVEDAGAELEAIDRANDDLDSALEEASFLAEENQTLMSELSEVKAKLAEQSAKLAEMASVAEESKLEQLLSAAVSEFRIGAEQIEQYRELGAKLGVDNLEAALNLLPAGDHLRKADTSLREESKDVVPAEFANDPHFPNTPELKAAYAKIPRLKKKYGKYL